MVKTAKSEEDESKNLTIDSLSAFIEEVERQYEKNKELVFRGHENVSYELKPSIGRGAYEKIDEESMLNEFCRRYYPYTSERAYRKLDLLFLAQHYGLPTRLLDWTYNPLIALYFACKPKMVEDKSSKYGFKEADGCVYVKTIPYKKGIGCNEKDVDPFTSFKENQILLPDNFDVRFRNQQGVFEIFVAPTVCSKGWVIKIIIPAEVKRNILDSLSHIGITEDFVYPDLEHLAKSIKKQYETEDNKLRCPETETVCPLLKTDKLNIKSK